MKPKKDNKKEENSKEKEYLDQLQRLQAEFENYQKRIEKEKIEFIKYAKEDIILKLLNIEDNFERAIQSINKTENKEEIKKGIQLIQQELKQILKEEGVKEISTNEEFNPEVHEALSKEPSKEKENTIIEVFQKGYILKDKIIRPAKVKLSGGKQNE